MEEDGDDADSLMRAVAAAPPVRPPAPAKPESDRFEIVRYLGEGGMGIVYEAIDRQRGARVALKTLRLLDGGSLFRFKREYRSIQGLHHPNLVSLGDLVEERGAWFLTMDLVRGEDFLRHVRGDHAKIEDALRQLAQGVCFLHAAGMVHRDLKPSNVLVDDAGRVVILDLGLVQEAVDRDAPDKHVVGTIAYMSPEQAAAQPVGPASDWYSVGVMLYEALTGQLPEHAEPAPPSALAPGVPDKLDRLCQELLRIDPKQRPSGEDITRRLGVAPAPSVAEAAPFVGRAAELDLLRDALANRPQLVAIVGDSGVGKSALVRRFVETLPADVLVLAGRCYERESVPYRAVDGVIDALTRYLARLPDDEAAELLPPLIRIATQLFPVLLRIKAIARAPQPRAHADPHELRRRAFEALRELLARIASRRPLVVIVDDLQWADADSLRLLDEILAGPAAPAMLFVAMGRALSAEHEWLRRARRVDIGALPPADARDLASLLLARSSSQATVTTDAVAEASGGHPLFIDTIIRHAGARGLDLDEALWSDARGQPDDSRRLLETLCVAGSPLTVRVALKAAAIDTEAADVALTRLRLAHLVRVTASEGVEPYHDRVRETVIAHLGSEELRRHNEHLATTLLAEPDTPAETLAVHLRAAGDVVRATEFTRRAGDEAFAAFAFERAANLYAMVLELSPDDSALRRRLGDAFAYSGRGAEAAREYSAAAARASKNDRVVLERRAAEELLSSGHIDDGLAIAGRVLAGVGMKLPETRTQILSAFVLERSRLRLRGLRFRERRAEDIAPETLERIDVGWSIVRGMGYVDPPRLSSVQARNLREALAAGEPSRIAKSLAMEAAFVGIAGDHARPRVERLLEIGRGLATRIADPFLDGHLAMSAAMLEFFAGNWRRATETLDRAASHFEERCQGVAWEVASCRTYALLCLFFRGELAELARRDATLRQDAQRRGDLYQLTTLRTMITPLALLAADQPKSARAEAGDAIHTWTRHGFFLEHYLAWVGLCDTDLYDRHPADAWQRTLDTWRDLERSLLFQVQICKVRSWHVRGRAALACLASGHGDARKLEREVRAASAKLDGCGAPWAAALAELQRAGLAHTTGDRAGARVHVDRAIAQLERQDMALYAACARRFRARLGADEAEIAVQDRWMQSHGVANPEAMTAMLAPG